MSNYVARRILTNMKNKNIRIKNSRSLILGCAFKKNCTDIRNSKIFDLADHLKKSGIKVDIYDPLVNATNTENGNKLKLTKILNKKYDVIILGVAHNIFKNFEIKDQKIIQKISVIYDLGNFLDHKIITERL